MDTLSFSNSISRNGSCLFVALIASLNIMAKTFAKIAKAFIGLSTMIVAIKKRLVHILPLEAKYAKMKSMRKIG